VEQGGYRKLIRIAGGVFLCVIVAWLLDRWSLGVAVDAYLFSYGFWVQEAVVAMAALTLIILISRVWLACWLMTTVLAALYVANYLKLHYLASPLTIEDYFLVRDLDVHGLSLFLHYVNVGWLFVALMLFAVTCTLLFWKERRLITGQPGTRVAVLVLLGGILSFGVSGAAGKHIFDSGRLRLLEYSPMIGQLRAGLISHLIGSANDMADAFDEPIDHDAVRQLVARVRADTPVGYTERDQMSAPDVVLIQSESFFNPDIISQVGDTSGLLPNIHRAMSQGEGGSMIVPTFGGGTIRTEFEVLTGIPLAAYTKVRFPYLQLGNDEVPSVARAFADSGYKTIAVHGNSGTFWSRRHALQVLGFSRFLTDSDFGRDAVRDGLYLSDHAMTDMVIDELKEPGGPKFIFAISIEAHGPYAEVPVRDEVSRGHIAQSPILPADASDEYSRYAYHIAHADQEFGRLWNYLEKRGRPYVLAFYGDHMPGFRYVYQNVSFKNGGSPQDQQIPWVAVGSRVQPLERQSIYAWMLPGQVLDLAGVKRRGYMSIAELVGRDMLDDSAHKNARREGLYSAARLDLQGKFAISDDAVDTNAP